MGQLGSIFEDQEEGSPGRRGPDLHVDIEVPPKALGDSNGFRAPLPLEIDHEGEPRRRADPHGDGDSVLLRLPDSLPNNAVLKLRGQGAESQDGRAGDLFVRVVVTDHALEARPIARSEAAAGGLGWLATLVLLALAGGGLALGWLLSQ